MERGQVTQAAMLSEQLLLSVAEQLKLPLLQIARVAELARINGEVQGLADIETTADMAVRLLDNYLFGARLALEPSYVLALEPVSIASVLYDSRVQLHAIARLYGVELDIEIAGKFGPVLANRAGLQSALVSLGYALIEALPSLDMQSDSKPLQLQLAVHRCRYGMVAGIYSRVEQLTADALRQGRKLHGHSRQPLAATTHSAGAGIFVADAILQAMDSQLQVSRHRNLYGLGVLLHSSPQLQLV